jgi:glyoxylase-like metal-dependent hydrolase (beta-lactamase superfamily II)
MVDAVWYPKRSENILKHIEKKWPDKKLKYTILTHHHIDHVGGVNAYAEAGSTVVTSKQNHHFFQTIISNNVSTAPTFIAIDGTGSLDGIGRRIEMYDIPNSHADGYLAVYIPDEKFLYNVDLYSPNRNQQHPVWNDEYRQGIEYYGIDVNAHIGGHGTGTAPHSDLLELN